ncbi:ATP-binding cassette domain-containing protein, partial [Pseudomonas aeruginosa]|nr:ATP-binding cassette domain-containing protein [Pseudomonas aeruginosa]
LAALNQFTGAMSSLDDAAEQHCIQQSIQRLKIKTSSPELAIGRLSGGNQQKAILARWLGTDARLFILDEPTLGVDIGARRDIYQRTRQLADKGRAVLVSSSDAPE